MKKQVNKEIRREDRPGLYVIRKYIRANSATEAIRLDRKKSVDDVWLDEEFKKQLPSAIGFNIENKNDNW